LKIPRFEMFYLTLYRTIDITRTSLAEFRIMCNDAA